MAAGSPPATVAQPFPPPETTSNHLPAAGTHRMTKYL
ncbi:unnamed protein product [Spirodela intermedia]|uniref:Uncharacterized protein n=1 Tax=Spirodela intermedia TaxID=51605 RepID=A0A7I8JHL9_SPIIN|nr:unnamed protein product [Spirodela intermedia]CAA6669043.1 unnamed protein product [Spirodela intermedia]